MKRTLLLSLTLVLTTALVHAQEVQPEEPKSPGDRDIHILTPEREVMIRISPDGEVVVEQDGESTVFHIEPGGEGGPGPFIRKRPFIAPRAEGLFKFGAPGDSNQTHPFGFEALATGRDALFGEAFEFMKGPWLDEDQREVREMEHAAHALALQARRAEGAERIRLEGELQERLNAIFDKKQEIRRNRVNELEERLREERDRLEERSGARGEIVERRQRELLGEPDSLDW